MPAAPLDRRQRPLADLRVSLTDRCNFRCGYCMPADAFPAGHRFLAARELLSAAEVGRLVEAARRAGVRKVRLTGGEPLLRADVLDVVARVAATGVDDIAMTTNGSLLGRVAGRLAGAGLHRLTVSLDSLDAATVSRLSGGRATLSSILAGIEAAEAAGFAPLKLNCVVRRGVNEDDILPLADFARSRGHVMRFIEYMDVGSSNRWRLDEVVPGADVLARIAEVHPVEAAPPSYAGEVAQRFRYRDGAGEVGVIASVTQPFCGNCTRLRVSADGTLYTCLFSTSGTPLGGLLREGSDAELDVALARVWRGRDDAYSEQRAARDPASTLARVEMSYIGG